MLLENIDLSDFADMVDDWEKDFSDVEIKDNSKKVEEIVLKIDKTEKKKECINLIKKLVLENKKIIIWCIFKKTMADFYENLNEIKISSEIINGNTSVNERKKIISDFKQGKFEVLITNPHTLGESVSLHDVCHDAIYFEYSYNLVHLLQSKDRIHRLGLKDNQYTQWYFFNNIYKVGKSLSMNYSMGEKVYKRLKEKEKIMINAIENNFLETQSSDNEDLNFIFEDLRNI